MKRRPWADEWLRRELLAEKHARGKQARMAKRKAKKKKKKRGSNAPRLLGAKKKKTKGKSLGDR